MNTPQGTGNVLITGASGGIGADLARIFARAGHRLALVARSSDMLGQLADELGTPGGARPLTIALDLSLPDAPAMLAEALGDAAFTTSILVNNAGYGLNGPVARLERGGQVGIIDLNIRALTDLTLQFLPEIQASKGKILNVASVAGFLPGPGMAIYYASKAYVLSFSEALAYELRDSGVTVTALCPGPTATRFFERASGRARGLKRVGMMASMPVAQAGYDGLMAGKRVVVPGFSNWIITAIAPMLPRALVLPVISRIQLGK
jgi:uncharacterized protein